jgi:hypothetical protein
MMRDGRRWMGVFLLLLLLNHRELKCQQQTEAFVDFKVVGKVKSPDGQLKGWQICASTLIHAVLPKDRKAIIGMTKVKEDGSFELSVRAKQNEPIFICAYFNGVLSCNSVTPIKAPSKSNVSVELSQMHLDALRKSVDFIILKPDGSALGRRVKAHLYNLYGEVTANTDGMVSDSVGRLHIDSLPAGLYDIWVESVEGDENGKTFSRSVFRCVEVTAGDGTQRVELKLSHSCSVRGRLLFYDGRPAVGCTVSVQSGTFQSPRLLYGSEMATYAHGAIDCYSETVVKSDGTFILTGLTEGTHYLDVRLKGEKLPRYTLSDITVKAGSTRDIGEIKLPEGGWQFMFDGQTIKGWKESNFIGRNEVRVENDRIIMLTGNDMTGITWVGELPRIDYEVTLQGMRVDGSDFFCGLTFPVGDSHCTLILGGWGGSVVGLSCIDGLDASQNETSTSIEFQNKRWYRIRVRVTKRKIEAWLDSRKIVDAIIEGRKISIRWECEPSIPFGIATWRTTGAVRDIRIRKLEAD